MQKFGLINFVNFFKPSWKRKNRIFIELKYKVGILYNFFVSISKPHQNAHLTSVFALFYRMYASSNSLEHFKIPSAIAKCFNSNETSKIAKTFVRWRNFNFIPFITLRANSILPLLLIMKCGYYYYSKKEE